MKETTSNITFYIIVLGLLLAFWDSIIATLYITISFIDIFIQLGIY